MSEFLKALLVIPILFSFQRISLAQDSLFVTPTYTLTATNIVLTQPNRIEFDVYLRHTNGNATPFIYGTAQYYWNFNSGVAYQGDTLKLSIIGSDLPTEYQPVNPSVTGNILRMAPNLPTNYMISPVIDTSNPGTLIARLRLRTTGSAFTNQKLNLEWRNVLPDPYTRIAAFTGENNILLYEIQNASSQFVGNYLNTQLISPADNSTDNTAAVIFSWNKNSATMNYDLQISTDSLFSSYFYNDSTLTDTSKFITGLANDTKYYWRVKTKDSSGNYYSSVVWNFRTLPYSLINLNLTVLSQGKYDPFMNLLRQKDSVTVYLRNSVAPFSIADSAEGVIDTLSYKGLFTFEYISSGNYYICVRNKQCIETWSKAGGEFMNNNGDTLNYDFTSSAANAYGSNQILVGSKYCFYSGDVNQDKYINTPDLIAVLNDARIFESGYYIQTDINGDNSVDIVDANICYNNSIRFIETIQP